MSTTTTRPSPSPAPPEAISASRRRLILAAAGAGLFVAALDTYVVVTVLPRVMFDLGVPIDHLEQATPIITGFLVGYIVTMPILGAVSDVYGRGRVYLACLGLFAAGSVLTATAGITDNGNSSSGLWWLVAGRVLQGLGGGALVPVALALAADLHPPGRRALPLGIIAALQETGSVLGPLYGALVAGAAAGFGAWRVIFWVNVPLALAAGVLYLVAARGHALEGQNTAGWRSVDWLGGGLLGAGLGLLVLALYPDDPANRAVGGLFVPLAVAAVAALGLYGWRQARRPDALIPPALARDPVFIGANLTNLLVGVALMVALVDIPIVARAVYGFDELGGALFLARFMVAIPIGALLGGVLAGRLGYRLSAALGLVIAGMAFARMSGWEASELSNQVLGLPSATVTLVWCGLGFGLVIAPVAAATLDRARARQHGLASSLVVLSRTVGMLLGLSSLTAFGLHRFYELVTSGPAPTVEPADPRAQLAALQGRVAAALLQEYHEIFLVTAVVCFVAALVALATLGGGGRAPAEAPGVAVGAAAP